MNDQQKRQMGQVIMLVVLLAILAGSTTFMLRSLSPKPSTPAPRPAPAATTAQPAPGAPSSAAPPPAGKKLTEMPDEIPTTSKGSAGSSKSLGNLAYGQLDPNLFKIYSLDPPRNPFAIEERWFASVIEEQLPGYPQLEDSKYFESPELYLPDVWRLIDGEEDWADAELKREIEQPEYTWQGFSDDNGLKTMLSLAAEVPPSPPGIRVKPTRAMTEPGWLDDLAAASTPPVPPDSTDLFNDSGATPEDGLPVPSSSEELPRTTTPPPGDSFSCQGVTHRGNSAYALMTYNGQAFIVHEGTVLPPYYQVYQIKEDGVVLQDRRDQSSKWIPISAGSANSSAMPNRPAVPTGAGEAEPSLSLEQLLQLLAPAP